MTSGGAEKVVLTLLNKFQEEEQSLELLCIEKEQFYKIPRGVNTTYLSDYESLENSLLKFPSLFLCAWRLKKHLKSHSRKIVQSHLLRASFINVIAKWLGSRHHAQIVLHSRINFEHKPFWYRMIAKWIYRQILHHADSVVSICETMKLELDEYLDLKKHPNHLVIYNPHNLLEIKEKSQIQPEIFHFSKDKQYIVSVGRIVKGKRLDDLIRAFSTVKKQIPNLELLFIGDGNEKSTLYKLTEKLKIEASVHFLGYQTNPYPYIAKSDVFVLSSEWEGLPNIIIESMVCGTPVISSDCISGPREILAPNTDLSYQLKPSLKSEANPKPCIEQAEFGMLYPVGDIHSLANALSFVLAKKDLQNRFIEKGYERAKDFEASKIVKVHLAFFKLRNDLEFSKTNSPILQ